MSTRPTAILVAVAALGITSVAATGAAAKRPSRPRIKKLSLAPRRLPGSGGSITLKVSVSGSGISSVRAQAVVTGGSGGSIVPLNARGRTYSGGVPVPANFRTSASTASVTVYVTANGSETQKRIGTVSLAPYDNSLPPPPPPAE